MNYSEEQIFIIYSVKGTESEYLHLAKNAISSFNLSSSQVLSVKVRPKIFEIPSGNVAGKVLNTELIEQIRKSIGAIVFLDDLRPNITYELGFFHGQGKPVLLITKAYSSQESLSQFSDLMGSSVLDLSRYNLEEGIANFLDYLYNEISLVAKLPVIELPSKKRNMLGELVSKARVELAKKSSIYGNSIIVDTWGGCIFDTNYKLFHDAKFKIVLKGLDYRSDYSIYFRIRYLDSNNKRKVISLGITSTKSNVGFEANERNFPSESLSDNWNFISYSFKYLMSLGQVLEFNTIECLELIRVRGGNYTSDSYEKKPGYEIGYFEIIGIDR